MAIARIVHDVIEPDDMIRLASAPAHGAVTLFLGVVREENDGRPVWGMRYDAYEAMAVEVLRAIADEAESQMDGGMVAVAHRIGDLAIGDVSVAIAAGSPHRAPAFDAARYVIEQIKLRLPVWKHEHYIDGKSDWLGGSVPPVTESAS